MTREKGFRKNLDLGGIPGQTFGAFTIELPAAVDILDNPKEQKLIWGFSAASVATAPASLLEKFLMLHDRPTSDILAFAKRWGVLEICKHGLPCTHSNCHPLEDRLSYWEPIQAWRSFSVQARAVLEIAASLRKGQPASMASWDRKGPSSEETRRRYPDRGHSKGAQAQA